MSDATTPKEIRSLKDLIGKDLKGFEVKEVVKVYKENTDGRRVVDTAYFLKGHVAQALADSLNVDQNRFRLTKVLALTNDEIAFLVRDLEAPITFSDHEHEEELRKQALEKLSKAQIRLLGL